MKKSIVFQNIQNRENKKTPILYIILLIVGAGFLLLSLFYILSTAIISPAFGKCVAVVEISGEIQSQDIPQTLFSEQVLGSESIAKKIRGLEGRPDVGAVVFVINSPGGSVVGSREIYRAIDSLPIPKVSYFREVAASGGYYIAAPTDYIISEPYAITGSIGVITQSIEFSVMMEKLGINATTITSGKNKDMGSPLSPMTDGQKEILQEISNEVFEDFKSVILSNRKGKLNMELFSQALDARILIGLQAKKIGLVDEVGTKDDAIKKAGELAGLGAEPRICKIDLSSQSSSLFDMVSFFRSFYLKTRNYKLSYSME